MTVAFWIAFTIVVCCVCSILETVLFSTQVLALSEHRKQRGIRELIAIKQERIGDAISAILIVNTLAGTVGPGFVGAEAARLWGGAAVGIASAILTVLVLLLAEVAPKTFAATHAMALAPATGRVLFVSLKILAPFLAITRIATRWIGGEDEAAISRVGLAKLITLAPTQNALAEDEAEMLTNILYANRLTLAEVRTPLKFVITVDPDAAASTLLERDDVEPYARLPLHQENSSQIPTFVDQRAVLRALLKDGNGSAPLLDFARQLPAIPEQTNVGDAIQRLLDAREPIGAVMSDDEVVGIVTLEDLFEALLGIHITDEASSIAQSRSEAHIIRQQRIDEIRKRRRNWTKPIKN